LWSKAFRDADGVGQVAWLERVKAWKANRNNPGNKKVPQHYSTTPAKYAQNFFRVYKSYLLLCQKLAQQRTKVPRFDHCFPDLENLEEQDGLTEVVRQEAIAFREAVMTGCHDKFSTANLVVNTLMPLHNK
jgi:hypothetical protein